MIPEILTETLATLRRFDPNGDWYTPDLPDNEADLLEWANHFEALTDLTQAARRSVFRMREAAKR